MCVCVCVHSVINASVNVAPGGHRFLRWADPPPYLSGSFPLPSLVQWVWFVGGQTVREGMVFTPLSCPSVSVHVCFLTAARRPPNSRTKSDFAPPKGSVIFFRRE